MFNSWIDHLRQRTLYMQCKKDNHRITEVGKDLQGHLVPPLTEHHPVHH